MSLFSYWCDVIRSIACYVGSPVMWTYSMSSWCPLEVEVGRKARDSVSAINTDFPFRYSTLMSYFCNLNSIPWRSRGAFTGGLDRIASRGLWLEWTVTGRLYRFRSGCSFIPYLLKPDLQMQLAVPVALWLPPRPSWLASHCMASSLDES